MTQSLTLLLRTACLGCVAVRAAFAPSSCRVGPEWRAEKSYNPCRPRAACFILTQSARVLLEETDPRPRAHQRSHCVYERRAALSKRMRAQPPFCLEGQSSDEVPAAQSVPNDDEEVGPSASKSLSARLRASEQRITVLEGELDAARREAQARVATATAAAHTAARFASARSATRARACRVHAHGCGARRCVSAEGGRCAGDAHAAARANARAHALAYAAARTAFTRLNLHILNTDCVHTSV
eukprot:6201830-Pleurochrysis_carterae.AAC.1